MAREYRFRITDAGWLANNRARLADMMRALPTFVGEKENGEIWLRSPGSTHDWDYDVRLFPEEDGVFVEVSSRSDALSDDVRALYEGLARETNVVIEDADDPD